MVGRKTIIINDKKVPIRSYEVSIWSLQDSFITVLKWANIENKGQIQDPEIVLDVDGTQNFKFSIPMYLKPGEENPAWYNTLNGNLMIGMRKIKVILNKKLEDEEIFEFLIVKVTERHEADVLFCDVECEGLAFHELGKIGYKISLSLDEFLNDYEEWFSGEQNIENIPRQTINYWNEKTSFLEPYPTEENAILIPNKWYYKIEMNWNTNGSNIGERQNDKIYEDEYVSSWKVNENSHILIPEGIQTIKEKERPVDIQESNIYNITQKIAEAFGVFCKYQYLYDDNYHIIGRVVIYYNNFIEEDNGHMDLTYPYHTSEITREMDSTELTTKLFVRPVDYQYSDSGQITIMSVDANKSREDYILNFDYLRKFDIISDEQYQAIQEYEQLMHNYNTELETISLRLITLDNTLTENNAMLTVAKNSLEEAQKQLNNAKDQIKALSGGDNTVHITQQAPKMVMVLTDESDDSFYVNMPFTGIIPKTVKLYDGIIDYTKPKQLEHNFSAQVKGGTLEFDPYYNDLIKITHLPKKITKKTGVNGAAEKHDLSASLWLTCDYVPETYWKNVRDYWLDAISKIQNQLTKYQEEILPPLEQEKVTLNTRYEELIEEKNNAIKDFEEMMGPALREGYWQPDNYQDYGNKYYVSNLTANHPEGKASYHPADTYEYEGNNKITYYEGQELKTYLLVNVDISNFNYIYEHYKDLCFIYYDIQNLTQALNENLTEEQQAYYLADALRIIKIGGECRFTYIQQQDGTIKFVLVIEASKFMSDNQLKFFKQQDEYNDNIYNNYTSKIGTVSINEDTTSDSYGSYEIDNEYISIGKTDYLYDINNQEVYRRIIIDSLLLKTGENDLQIKLNNLLLKQYEDYIIRVNTDLNDDEEVQHDKYMIDIKPEAFIKAGNNNPRVSISYALSNADIFIYLDALQVSKENAEPKVSYTIALSLYDPYILHNIYKKLSKIVHINDLQLKFENVQGYISHIEMHLDMPWEDTIEIKNYKTKFEDLFSNIVAQTDAMQKKSYGYDVAATAFDSTGALTAEAFEKMLDSNTSTFQAYIDQHLTDSQALNSTLTEIFNEAGQIIGSAGNALSNMRALTSRNSSILASFAREGAWGLSQVQVNEEGIFIGSDQKISLFSGNIESPDSGVSIDLNPQRLILGATAGAEGTAAKFTDKYLVLSAGDIISSSEQVKEEEINGEATVVPVLNLEEFGVNGLSTGLVGAKFTKDSIGLATTGVQTIDAGTENEQVVATINSMLMNNNGITLGSGMFNQGSQGGIDITQSTGTLRANNNPNASFVRIAGTGIDIGSGAELYVDTQNFKINSNAKNDESIFELSKTEFDEATQTSTYIPALKYSTGGGLEISGRIVANELKIYDPEFSGADKYRFASDWVNAKVTPREIWLKVKKATDPAQNNSDYQNTSLQLTDNMISIASTGTFNVNTANLIINSAATGTKSIFELKKLTDAQNNTYSPILQYSLTNGLKIDTENVIINTAATGDNAIFRIGGSGNNYKILYSENAGLKIKGEMSADTGYIGGWKIDTNLLSSGEDDTDNNTSTYVALDSNKNNKYAIWAGDETSSLAPFRVRRDGKVYLHSLMVLDERVGTKWGLGGTHYDEYDETVIENDQSVTHHYGYAVIDFSKLNFKQAVSVTGSWSGSAFNVNVSLWGILNKQESLSASISVDTEATFHYYSGDYTAAGSLLIQYLPGGGSDDLYFSLNCKDIYDHGYANADAASIEEKSNMANYGSFTITRGDGTTKDLTCSVQKAYNAGWNACRQAMLNSASSHTYYNGPSQVYNQSLDVWVTNTDRVSVTTYTVPAAK